jgi:hypothetical protein
MKRIPFENGSDLQPMPRVSHPNISGSVNSTGTPGIAAPLNNQNPTSNQQNTAPDPNQVPVINNDGSTNLTTGAASQIEPEKPPQNNHYLLIFIIFAGLIIIGWLGWKYFTNRKKE